MTLKNVYVVCEDHIEWVIDVFVDELEKAPDVIDLQRMTWTEGDLPEQCMKCEQKARYVVQESESEESDQD